jgi:GIY-YIG catalytic domain
MSCFHVCACGSHKLFHQQFCWHRQCLVIYQVECKNTVKVYIGNTQQHLKTRMGQHATDVRRKKLENKNSDSFASHFADQMRYFQGFSNTLHKNMYTCTILWQANPHSAVKTFGTTRCILCSRERLEIVKMHRFKPELLINSCNEIYGACRTKLSFTGIKAMSALIKPEGRKGH